MSVFSYTDKSTKPLMSLCTGGVNIKAVLPSFQKNYNVNSDSVFVLSSPRDLIVRLTFHFFYAFASRVTSTFCSLFKALWPIFSKKKNPNIACVFCKPVDFLKWHNKQIWDSNHCDVTKSLYLIGRRERLQSGAASILPITLLRCCSFHHTEHDERHRTTSVCK